MNKKLRQEIENKLYLYKKMVLTGVDSLWFQAIYNTLVSYADTEKYILFVMRYIDMLPETKICMDMHIDRTTYYRWSREIVFDVALQACYLQLVNPNEI